MKYIKPISIQILQLYQTRFMLLSLDLIFRKRGGTKMFPSDILVETPPPTMNMTRQACNPSFDVKGGDISFPINISEKQYLCQTIKIYQILHKIK
jgi:hypothetical protein